MKDVLDGVTRPGPPWRHPAIIALLLIQVLFLVKYGERQVGLGPSLLGGILVSLPFLWGPLWHIRVAGKWTWAVLAPWSLGLLLALHEIPPWHIQVDRWDAVVFWWDAALRGDFPYSARTRMDGFPSPLPGLQLLLAPFALWGDLAWATFGAWGLWVAWIWRRSGHLALPQLALALLAAPVLWEILCRSTLLVNSLLLLLFLWAAPRLVKRPALAGSLAGLLLSTRIAFLVPLLGWGLAEWRSGDRPGWEIPRLGLWALAIFCLSLSPLWLAWGWDAWSAHNPLGHHQKHMPWSATAALLILSLALGWRRPRQQLQNAAWVLLGFGVLYCGNAVLTYGWQQAWYAHRADISYLLFAWPLLWTWACSPRPAFTASKAPLA